MSSAGPTLAAGVAGRGTGRSERMRLAGAPISWGVCEVPGWGYQLAPELVLAQMRDLGLTATEFGPPGFLPADPADRAAILNRHQLTAAGGFLAVVLHEQAADPAGQVERALAEFAAAGADVLVLAAATGGPAMTRGRSWTGRAGRRCWTAWTGPRPWRRRRA